MTTQEATLVTATEFVTDILCELALHDVKKLRLVDTMQDRRFEKAYEMLREQRSRLNIALDFSLATNPYHGDSSTLREAIYGLREQGVVSINNPSFKTVEVQVDRDDADYFLTKSSIPRHVVTQIVNCVFIGEGMDGQQRVTSAN
ncbi:hypothetical protein [Sphingomonas hengshuiensis]|uniref:Uncharacterized protein n=1 Tax=Sphingomonas hengshuiensis TaxID=1609977 RepID=A0A7U4LGL9_9SPHN|nr:hypothetical protein [Sphingomonas hengshuiensis]AJP73704.1 hypothetical protein TS85_20750 [Sphingomonas hengshuiensis]